jgi:hypothetical protein
MEIFEFFGTSLVRYDESVQAESKAILLFCAYLLMDKAIGFTVSVLFELIGVDS